MQLTGSALCHTYISTLFYKKKQKKKGEEKDPLKKLFSFSTI